MPTKKILLIDGHGIAFRAFYAIQELNAPDGTPTNAVVGFFNMLHSICQMCKPDEIYTAFDMKGPTFRHLLYPEYKQTRKPTDEALKVQIPILREMLPLLGIHLMERSSVEADDLLGSAAVFFAERGDDVTILTSDKDIMQVLRPHVRIIRPVKGVKNFNEYSQETFTEEYGFSPKKMVDYLALMGDTADNIKGVDGVGAKTASRFMHDYGSIENLVAHIDELKPAMKRHVAEGSALAIENRKLTRLKCDEDLSEFLNAEAAPDYEKFKDICARLGLKKVASMFVPSKTEAAREESAATVAPEQQTIEPMGEIPLETILLAPLLALDVDIDSEEKNRDFSPELLKEHSAILAAPDGSWWRGSLEALAPHYDELLANRVLCFDAKTFCRTMERPRIAGLWDIKTAWYILHPDLGKYDAADLELPFSPQRTLRLFSLAKEMERQLNEQNCASVMTDIDLPLIPSLTQMERRGIRLDRGKMLSLSEELEKRISDITRSIYETVGGEINLNSPKQVGEILFEKLGLPPIKKTKSKNYSTNVAVLEELNAIYGSTCAVPGQLLEYRELQKMASGFVQPLLAAAERDGVIHSTFESHSTGTGRLSSRDPNMQNLPNYSDWGTRIRECLIPHDAENSFVAADYSQIELRVLAHLSGDQQLIDIFNSDRDIHTETASLIYGLPSDAITKELRRNAKTVSFGLIYGMNTYGLAARLGCDNHSAKEIIDAYFAALPGVSKFINSSLKVSMNDGYTQTLFGRRRPIEEISTGRGRDHQKRAAVNSPIQGTAADITKIAMTKVAEHFAGKNVHMVLQVHDSIVCECPTERAEETASELAQIMENAVKLSVPLKTEQSYGKTLATI